MVALLTLMQPLARLSGRLRGGLTPWRSRRAGSYALPIPSTCSVWSEQWHAPADALRMLEEALRARRLVVMSGGDFDRWDIYARGGPLGGARLRLAVEDHGGGRQLFRYRIWPVWARGGLVTAGIVAAAIRLAAERGQLVPTVLLMMFVAWIVTQMLTEAAASVANVRRVARRSAELVFAIEQRPAAEPPIEQSPPVEQPTEPLQGTVGALGDAA